MTTVELTPSERLTLSRERLRRAMTRKDAPPSGGTAAGNKPAGLDVLDLLKLAVPSAGLVIDALTQWWAGHPLQASGNLVEGVVEELLRPLAKRHPLALVASALAVGALVVWIRPWRWALKPHVLNTWGPAVLSSTIASSAFQSWLSGFVAKNAMPQTQQTTQAPASSAAQTRPSTGV